MRLSPLFLSLSLALLSLAGCGNADSLPDATVPNVVDTVTLYALEGTPITTPSAYVVEGSRAVRVDTTAAFDFAYNTDAPPAAGRRQFFLPLEVLGISSGSTAAPGLQARTEAFDAITEARSNGYVTDDTVAFTVGNVFVVRGRIGACSALGVPQYGKLQVLAVDTVARTVTFQVLTDNNCGYRGLQPGLPTN